MSLLRLPSLDAPEISPALFGQAAIDRLKPLLYWVQVAERYLPPGLRPRLQQGPKRLRMSGNTVVFPRPRAYPQFLLRFGEADLSIGGGVAAGNYIARVSGLTTEPTLYGRPLRFVAQRTGGRVGPGTVRVAGMLDHTGPVLRDSAGAFVSDFAMSGITIPQVQARVDLGRGTTELSLFRNGDQIVGRWFIRSTDISWQRLADSAAAFSGVRAEIKDFLWRTIEGVTQVEVEAQFRGSVRNPSLSIRSNLGEQLARSLRQQLGAEVERAERMVRARVDSLVQERLAEARARLEAVQSEVQSRVAEQRAQLEAVKAELEGRIREMTRVPGLPGGLQLPVPR